MRYAEDFTTGDVHELGTVSLTAEEIMDFARRYDPQPFHTDPEAARGGPFGGLVASGWHTAAVVMRLFVDRLLLGTASLGSPGMDEVRWPAPVRPGDVLTVRYEVLESRLSASRPDRGVVRGRWSAVNQDGTTALTLVATNLVGRRPT